MNLALPVLGASNHQCVNQSLLAPYFDDRSKNQRKLEQGRPKNGTIFVHLRILPNINRFS